MDLNENTLCDSSRRTIGKHCSNGMRVRDMIRRYDTSIQSSKSSYCGLNVSGPLPENDFHPMFDGKGHSVQSSSESLSRCSSESEKTICDSRSPRELPKAAPRQKKDLHSEALELQHKKRDEQMNCPDISYQSKTTILKTPTGVRIIVDIYFDKNKGIAIEDVVGSRVETDIPPSKILKEFQKRITDTCQD